MTSLLNLWGPPVFPATEKEIKNFCPICKRRSEWKHSKQYKTCKTCGLKVKVQP
jgi:uncharacterized protein (DUF983 family)